MTKLGRKTKLTPELKEKIRKRLIEGFYIKQACQAVGIGRRTYYYWKEKGEKAEKKLEEGKKLSDKENEFLHFLHTTQQAEAEGELNIFLEIRQQVKKDWRAGMEILGRKYPKRWGKKESVKVRKEVPLKEKNSKALRDFMEEEKLMTPEQRERFIKTAIKFEKEIEEEEKEYKA